MRRVVAAGAVVTLAAGAVVALASPAFAGEVSLVIDVTVVGPVPAGATFTVHYSCTTPGSPSGDFMYHSDGTPFTENGIGVGGNGTCTVTETMSSNAANVAFTCVPNGTAKTCGAGGDTVTFGLGTSTGPATLTVFNAYLPNLTVSPQQGFPGQQFTVSSTGCTNAVFGGSSGTGGPVQVTAGFTPPIVMNTTAAATTGAWSVPFTIPAGASSGPVAISATCSDPVAYASSSFTVLAAATPLVAAPAFTG
jgi:hypothetical protein